MEKIQTKIMEDQERVFIIDDPTASIPSISSQKDHSAIDSDNSLLDNSDEKLYTIQEGGSS